MARISEKALLSRRVSREKEELLSARPEIDVERLKILVEVYGDTRLQPNTARRATLFYRLCSEKTIHIDANPIVGTLTTYKYGAHPVPEEGCAWMQRTEEFALPRGKVRISPEVREWVNRAVELWRDSNLYSMTRDVVRKSCGLDISDFSKCGVWLHESPGGASHMIFPDYDKVLQKGITGIAAEIDEAEAGLNLGEPGTMEKWHFYQSARLALSGLVRLSQRYASLARQMAETERDPERKAELKDIAVICDRVPSNPARNFREALQAFWFVMLGVWLEAPMALTSPPTTFTRSLYPFYRQDREEGRITDDEAIELIQFFFLKINQLAYVLPPHGFRLNQSRLGQQLGVGGLRPDGEDATNDLDWLVLEAQQRIKLPEPLINIVYHDKLSHKLLLKCIELIRTGIGQPAFHDSRSGVLRHLYHHRMPLEEARPFVIAGCVQSLVPGYMDGYWMARFNVAKMVEFVLENGKDLLTGKQLGPQTGDAASFRSYDELYQAFVEQLRYFIPLAYRVSRIGWTMQRNFPTPFGSSLVNDCIKEGKDVSDGGARYSFGDGVCLVGVVDAANSLAAIKKLVFEEKKIGMGQLRSALAADFEGYEDLHRLCLNAPKYGNDDDWVDSIARGVYDLCYELHPRTDHLGRPVMPQAYSVTAHAAFGTFTAALPSGRRARKPLVDASVSAQGGTDRSGPTALVRSAARIVDTVKFGSNHLNMKFHPTALRGAEGANKLLSLIKTYFDLGGYHVQFNCVSSETLRDAQEHPEKHRDLVVRVAGFSAYFVNLDKDVQDDIIARTQLAF